jgi:hypothetical protein
MMLQRSSYLVGELFLQYVVDPNCDDECDGCCFDNPERNSGSIVPRREPACFKVLQVGFECSGYIAGSDRHHYDFMTKKLKCR